MEINLLSDKKIAGGIGAWLLFFVYIGEMFPEIESILYQVSILILLLYIISQNKLRLWWGMLSILTFLNITNKLIFVITDKTTTSLILAIVITTITTGIWQLRRKRA